MKCLVLKCVPRRDGSFLVMLQGGGNIVSPVKIEEGRRVTVRDGKIVEGA